MSQQQFFTAYCYVVVGVLGNVLIGWEVGRKGIRRVSLEGPRNKKITFALVSFMVMVLWGATSGLKPPYNGWRDAWPPFITVAAYALARATTPRSQRLFDRAKYLHEMTSVGDWRGSRTDEEIAAARANPQLLEADRLYRASAAIQERLASEAALDVQRRHHRRNVATVYCQLSLLYVMQSRLPDAIEAASTARRLAEELGDDTALGEAFYSLGLAEKSAGDKVNATAHLRLALAIEERMGNEEGAAYTRMLLEQIAEDP